MQHLQVLYTMQRDTHSTNQRISFDIEPCGRHLATGDAYLLLVPREAFIMRCCLPDRAPVMCSKSCLQLSYPGMMLKLR